MRAFIAVPLPASLRAKLVALQQDLQRLPLEATWVREAAFHLTLKFLGEIDPTQIGSIFSCMSATAKHYHPFALSLSGVGVFPNANSPRVLWVGVQDVTGALRQIQQTLDARLTQIGFPPEDRPFAPHLTLARVKRVPRRGELVAGLNAHREAVVGQLDVDHLELVESQLHPSGAHYSLVNAVHLPCATDTPESR